MARKSTSVSVTAEAMNSANDAIIASAAYVAESKQNAAKSRQLIISAVIAAAVALRFNANLDVKNSLTGQKVALGTAKLVARLAPRLAADKTMTLTQDVSKASFATSLTELEGKGAGTMSTLRKRYNISPEQNQDPLKRLQSVMESIPTQLRPAAERLISDLEKAWKEQEKTKATAPAGAKRAA